VAGDTKQSVRASELARRHVERAIGVLSDIIADPDAYETKDALKAAEMILDRAEGKAAQAIITVPTQRRRAVEFAGMSNAELMDAIDAEFEEAPRKALPAPNVDDDPLLG
jgi:hypothetical protein